MEQLSKLTFANIAKLLLVFVVVIFAFKYLKKGGNGSDGSDVGVKDQTENEKKALQAATSLVTALNTGKGGSGWNPANWGEDEEKAIEILNASGGYITTVENYYNKLSRSGSLIDDLNSLMSEEERALIQTI